LTSLDDPRRTLGATLAGLLVLTAGAAHAQVLEIGDGGAVTRYDGPAVVTSEGVRPLLAEPPAPAGASTVARAVDASARRHGLDPALLGAVARRESGWRQDAVSSKGAIGIMQLMPGTARDLGVDPRDAAANVEGGAAYLAGLMKRYGGDVATALAAYNAGPAAVVRFRGAPPFPETKAYVNSVLADWGKSVVTSAKVGM
jgi:soluble lytic murein transglycosylase-like protein